MGYRWFACRLIGVLELELFSGKLFHMVRCTLQQVLVTGDHFSEVKALRSDILQDKCDEINHLQLHDRGDFNDLLLQFGFSQGGDRLSVDAGSEHRCHRRLLGRGSAVWRSGTVLGYFDRRQVIRGRRWLLLALIALKVPLLSILRVSLQSY